MFTQSEITYLHSQRLARIATASPDGQPDAVPVGFEFDGVNFYVGGRDLKNTRKYKNILAGNNRVALVIDDLQSVTPWRPRGIRIYGLARLVEREGRLGHTTYISIIPQVSWSWGLEGASLNRTVHA
jgi:pyridoxamine 5'-phosphate oxidase family protein